MTDCSLCCASLLLEDRIAYGALLSGATCLTQVICYVGAGGSEKKLAAKATAARKLHYTAGTACLGRTQNCLDQTYSMK